jgi:hypothetical protein
MSIMEEKWNRLDWMDDTKWECAKFLAELFGGFNHLYGKFHEARGGLYINCTNASNKFATFDFDYLTRAVIMAHDQSIRFSIEPSGPGMLKLCATKRATREGRMSERHPTLEDAIRAIGRKQIKV